MHNLKLPQTKKSCENIAETINNKDIQYNQWNTHKLIEPDYPIQNGESTCSDSSSSFSSGEYFECHDNVIANSEIVGMVEPNTAMESLSSLMSGSWKNVSSHEAMKETEESKLQSALAEVYDGQHLPGVMTDKSSDLVLMSVTSQQGTGNTLHQIKTDAPDENTECLQICESYSAVNHMFDVQPGERNNSAESQLLGKKSLQDTISVPYVPVQKTAQAQCKVFSDTVNKHYTSKLKSALEVNDNTLDTTVKTSFLNNSFQKGPYIERCEEACKLLFQIKPLIAGKSKLEQAIEVKDMDSSNSEP